MKKLIFLLITPALLWACSREEPEGIPVQPGKTGWVEMTIGTAKIEIPSGTNTRGKYQQENSSLTYTFEDETPRTRATDDQKITTLRILQFNSGGVLVRDVSTTTHEVAIATSSPGTGNTQGTYTVAAKLDVSQTGNNTFYFLADTDAFTLSMASGTLAVGSTTLNQFETNAYLNVGGAKTAAQLGEKIPKSGKTSTTLANLPTAVITLTRLMAKVSLTLKNSYSGFTPTGIIVRNIPTRAYLAYKKGNHSLAYATASLNLTPAAFTAGGTTYTWYQPENVCGTNTAVDVPSNKHELNKPAGTLPTSILIAGNLNNALVTNTGSLQKQTGTVTYSIYLGENATNNYSIKSNTRYSIASTITGASVYDGRVALTKLDAVATANSYMIPATTVGITYSFSTGKRGNGVTPPMPGSGYYGTTSHATTNTGTGYAEVIWQDVNGLITNVSYSSGTISFRKSASGSGNAVIGIKTSAGATTYIWSWHIWVTDAPLTHQFNNLTWMDRNLGATTNMYDAAGKAKGLFYQWGRKDPFPSGNGWADTEPPLYGAKTSIAKTAVAAANNLTNAIGNPVTFYTGTDWATNGSSRTTQQDNLWGSTTNDNTGKKTLYDPCPPGWRVPHRNAWTTPVKLTTTNFPWNQTGYTYGRIISGANSYYPASGYRNDSSGILLGSTLSGYYWSSAPSSSTSNGIGLMNFTNTVMNSQNSGYRTFGFLVRCVRE